MEHDEAAPGLSRKDGELIRDVSIVAQHNGFWRKLRRYDFIFPALILRGMIAIVDEKIYGFRKFPQACDGVSDQDFSHGGVFA